MPKGEGYRERNRRTQNACDPAGAALSQEERILARERLHDIFSSGWILEGVHHQYPHRAIDAEASAGNTHGDEE